MVHVRYIFWQGNHQIYGHIRCIYTVLANPECYPQQKHGCEDTLSRSMDTRHRSAEAWMRGTVQQKHGYKALFSRSMDTRHGCYAFWYCPFSLRALRCAFYYTQQSHTQQNQQQHLRGTTATHFGRARLAWGPWATSNFTPDRINISINRKHLRTLVVLRAYLSTKLSIVARSAN